MIANAAPLQECAGCRRWSRWLSAKRRCGWCVLGWRHCAEHGRLEHDDGGVPSDQGGHRRVTVAEVLVAVPDVARSGGGS